jgi:cytochrome c-type biogenesis protein CcmH
VRALNPHRVALCLTAALFGALLAAFPLAAQEATPAVTFDQVNVIANKLYCPVCPNETLDACQTQACVQWRDQIREGLEAGQSEQQIIDGFVQRYGDRVLGTPQDPTLRALSLVTPFLVAGVALVVGVYTFLRWRARPKAAVVTPAGSTASSSGGDAYRDQLEQDLRE